MAAGAAPWSTIAAAGSRAATASISLAGISYESMTAASTASGSPAGPSPGAAVAKPAAATSPWAIAVVVAAEHDLGAGALERLGELHAARDVAGTYACAPVAAEGDRHHRAAGHPGGSARSGVASLAADATVTLSEVRTRLRARLSALGNAHARDTGPLDRLAARLRRPLDRRFLRAYGKLDELERISRGARRAMSSPGAPARARAGAARVPEPRRL